MDQQGQPPDDRTTPDGEMAQSQDRVEHDSPPFPNTSDLPTTPQPTHQSYQDHQYPQQSDQPQQVYGQPQYSPYPAQESSAYSPPPQSHMGGDHRPDNQPMYGQPPQQPGNGDYYPPQQQQPQPYYTGGPPNTYFAPPKKKGLPTWAWVAPLIAILLLGGGFGTWAYMSAQKKAAADARATSTAVAQGYATSTAQAQGTSTAVARATSTAIAGRTSTAIAGKTATAAAQADGSGNASLFKAAAANMKAAQSYHMDITANQAGQDIRMAGDIDVVNNKSKLDVSVAGQNVSAISIGNDSYISMDGGANYIKSPTNIAESLESFTRMWDNFRPTDIDSAKDALKDGSPSEETIGNDNTRHITASTKDLTSLSTSGSATDGVIDLWITTGDKPTIRKLKIAATSSGQNINATIEWTKVNQTFTIDAPATP